MPSYCPTCGELMKNGACKCGRTGSGLAPKADTFEADGLSPVHTQYTDAYVSSGLDKNIDDGLRRMLDMKPQWVDKNCCKCGKGCSEGAIEGPYGPEQGQPFCSSCFEKTFSKGNCHNCKKAVYAFDNQKWIKQDGKVFHDACFNEERRCHVCRKPIFGGAVNALGRDYHENCFQCGSCQSTFKGSSFFEYGNAPYCGKCYDEAAKSNPKSVTKVVTKQGVSADALNAKVAQRQGELEDLKKFQHVAIGDKCTKCQKDILTNALTFGPGMLFHPECFTCGGCSKGFPDLQFSEKGGIPFHPACLEKETAERCAGCHQPIVKGKQLTYEGKKYHAECFKCGGCGKGLAGVPFGEADGRALCESCLTSPPKVIHGEHRAGFTVNPVSGRKEERGAGGAKIGAKPAGLGGGDACPGCGKAAFMSERVGGPMGTFWHRNCLKCATCSKQLDSMGHMKNDTVYCRDCSKKA